MSEGSNRIRIKFVQKGPSSQMKNDFSLENDKLSEILDCWEKAEGDFDIQVYINDVLSSNAIIGATNTDKIFNLKTFLKTYWQKNQISLKYGMDFRKVMAKHRLP